ncbi:MAG: hypothetical protein IIA66_07610 [Planctomycetes bacterium]|nr:hypothetical protein [Planctomycetota bacterium]
MPSLIKQQDFRKVQNLPFCYLCGGEFKAGSNINRDHVPASALFLKEDRDVPLILSTHVACNAKEHASDQLLGQLIDQIHGRPINPGYRKLDATVVEVNGQVVTITKDLNIHQFIRRCVRAFHAALYHEWLPSDTANAFHPPLRGAQLDGDTGSPTDEFNRLLMTDQSLNQHALFSRVLKQNRVAKNTDQVLSQNGKCSYDCVWSQLDDGQPICIFGLKIYDWQRFGELAGYPNRGCVGFYGPKAGRPATATVSTELEFPFPNEEILDPFGN